MVSDVDASLTSDTCEHVEGQRNQMRASAKELSERCCRTHAETFSINAASADGDLRNVSRQLGMRRDAIDLATLFSTEDR